MPWRCLATPIRTHRRTLAPTAWPDRCGKITRLHDRYHGKYQVFSVT